jgi:hypothetical protein
VSKLEPNAAYCATNAISLESPFLPTSKRLSMLRLNSDSGLSLSGHRGTLCENYSTGEAHQEKAHYPRQPVFGWKQHAGLAILSIIKPRQGHMRPGQSMDFGTRINLKFRVIVFSMMSLASTTRNKTMKPTPASTPASP